MFGRKPKIESTRLEPVINRVIAEMEEYGPLSPEYPALMKKLKKLYELKSKDKSRIDPNTVILGAINILGILVIVSYEHAHAVTSKAAGFVFKPKI